MVVISPGVDVHTFRPLKPEETKVETDLPARYIFCLSRIDTNKGHDFLLYAFDKVRTQIPDIDLVIGGGSLKPQPRELEVRGMMEEIIAEKDMHERVHIIGYVPDEMLVPHYRQAELFVLPSVFEPFGMTTLEAMACGVPVVASKFGGIRTVIDSGKNGLLVDPTDPDEFSEAIVKILKDQKLAEYLEKQGYQTIQKYYSWEAIAERHIKFYARFIG